MVIKDWTMSYAGYENLSCEAPCSLYDVLIKHGIIDDPYFGLNDIELTALSDSECVFESVFTVDDEIFEKDYVELTFYGIDTLCDVTLNGTLILKSKNMHRTYTCDVKEILCHGCNILRLEFSSPTKYFAEMDNRHYVFTQSDTIPGAAHLRKALYMSGWDWSPKLPDMGIFRKVELNAYDLDRIDNVFITQRHSNSYVELEFNVETKHNAGLSMLVKIDGQCIRSDCGRAVLKISDPKLWWVRGYGEQYLYDYSVTLISGDGAVDLHTGRIGLRTLEVSTRHDCLGSEFCFVLNGVKIFAMGADYVPQDNILPYVSPERIKRLLDSCADANFNCIRVWGGGYYPEDLFYDTCDELGIMVWQDFMIACVNVYLTNEFKNEIIAEAVDNLKRIRNHPSLALLCGNNEMEETVLAVSSDNQLVREDYINLYERILPEICGKYAPQTFYWPSSPSSGGGFENPSNKLKGDSHYWKVWHGGVPFQSYRDYQFRFCSEYGFESYPSVKTLKSVCRPEDMNCFSRVVENHQKCRSGNAKILTYLADNYLYPYSFENLVYVSQLMQADAIKYGVEHFRRNRGICMGSLYWQLNDCWPGVSWSSIDYFGRYKALHYAAKKFYAPVSMGLFVCDGRVSVNISNETMRDFSGKVEFRICKSDFSIIDSHTVDVSVKCLTSSDVAIFEASTDFIYDSYICAYLFDESGKTIARQTELLCRPKHFNWENPNIKITASDGDNGVEFYIRSDRFAKGVFIDFKDFDCNLSDNWFDLTDSDGVKVVADTAYTVKELLDNVIVKSVYDIGM